MICIGLIVSLLIVLPVSALQVWHTGYDEFTDTYVLAILNDGDIPMSNVKLRINEGKDVLVAQLLGAQSRVNYRISDPGLYTITIIADDVKDKSFELSVSQDKKLNPKVAEGLHLLAEQKQEYDKYRDLKAMEREKILETQKLQDSSRSEIVAVEQTFDINALFVKIIMILFVVVGGLALYEFFITKSREEKR